MKSMIKAEYEGINKSSPNEMGKMHALERIDFILGTLKRDKVVLVTELSKQLNVSEETIRSDLKKIGKTGTVTSGSRRGLFERRLRQ